MAQLIQMRQRIKAIETIKKITHAMRLISMSSHSQLKNQQDTLSLYADTLAELFEKVYPSAPQWSHSLLKPEKQSQTLVIFIGSQKGLCGSFNSFLCNYFEKHKPKESPLSMIAIGQKAIEYARSQTNVTLVNSYEKFTIRTLFDIAHNVITSIADSKSSYGKVFIASNQFKSFFIQKPQLIQLVPFVKTDTNSKSKSSVKEYIWEQEPSRLLDTLIIAVLEARIQSLLFDSLLAEHAARFISMDNSTRNAKELLEQTKLQYNKLRQAKITKELTELVSSFQ